jgi:ATP-binding cassette subfamily B protein
MTLLSDRPDVRSGGGGLPFEPVGVAARYEPPRAWIHPDQERSWIRRMAPILFAHRLLLVSGIVSSLLAMLVNVAVPAVTRSAIDRALIGRTSSLSPFIWTLLILAALRGLLVFVYRYGLYRMAYEIEYDLRTIIYEHLSRLSFSFYDRVQSGQLISRANSDIRSVQMVLAFAPLMAISCVSFVIAFTFMLTINVPLTIVAVVTLPAVYVLGARLRALIFPLSWIIQGRLADIATIVDENVNGVRVVKSFAAEARQVNQLADAAQRVRWASITQNNARARYAPVMENLPELGLALVLLYGGYLAIHGEVTVGTLFAFNAYVLLLQAPFRMLGFFMLLAQRAAASAERIYEILDEPVAIADRPGAVDLVDPRGVIEFLDVSFAYDGGPLVLDKFNLRVSPGETVAIVGRTGGGKSTVARLLDRFYDVTGGAVLVDGHDVRDLTLPSLRAAIGIVLDEPFLFSVSIADNIAYGNPTAAREEIAAAATAASAATFIEALPDGYDTVVGERGYTLSGGQRQRIAIARTLLVNPPMLVLDDATSAIDVQIEELIHAALRERLADRSTIVIAHRLSTISLADRVALLEGGRVVATGTHTELMATEPRYAEVLAHLEDPEPGEEGT